MPLVKAGRSSTTATCASLDDAPMPEWRAGASCRRRACSPTARDIARREAPTGVLWPNNRKVAELAPYLDRLALVALVFPTFKDGRAYSQARLLRERYGFRGELRATGDVLRDQFLFLARAGFDAFEVKKEADAAAFVRSARRATACSISRPPTPAPPCSARAVTMPTGPFPSRITGRKRCPAWERSGLAIVEVGGRCVERAGQAGQPSFDSMAKY